MVFLSEHGVFHDVVPVLARAHPDQYEHAHPEIVEVIRVIDHHALSYRFEQESGQYRENEVDEHEKGENVEEGG